MAGAPQQLQVPIRFQDMSSDMIQECLNLLSLHRLFILKAVHNEFKKAYVRKCKGLGIDMTCRALNIIPRQLLCSLSHFLCRAFREWQNPIIGNDFQTVDNLDFSGAPPFPHPRFLFAPEGAISLYIVPDPMPQPAINAYLPNHAYTIESKPLAMCLRETTYLKISICLSQWWFRVPKHLISLCISREEGGNPGRIDITLSPPDDTLHPHLCGAVLYMFFNRGMRPIPRMLRRTHVRIRLMNQGPQDLRVDMPLGIREGLAACLVGMRRKFPLTKVTNAHNADQEYELEDVFYES
jgi:hypothetical protein